MPLPVVRPSAETPMADDFLCDPPVDSKRYAVDPSDSAFNVMTSQYPTKNPYGYRGSSCSTPMGVCRQASSPGSFQDANRNGEAVWQTPPKREIATFLTSSLTMKKMLFYPVVHRLQPNAGLWRVQASCW